MIIVCELPDVHLQAGPGESIDLDVHEIEDGNIEAYCLRCHPDRAGNGTLWTPHT